MTDIWVATIQYSYNRSEWVNYEEGTPLEFGNEELYIRGEYNDSPDISSSIGHIHFDGDAEVRCTGNIMDLLNYHNSNETTIHSCYRFESLFADCVQLIEAPDLPALYLANFCYDRMFAGCVAMKYLMAMFIDCEYTSNYCQITDMIDPVESGTFVKNAAATWPDIAVVKPGWTVVLATE